MPPDSNNKSDFDSIIGASNGMRLQTLVYIRWLAVLGQALTVFIVHFAFSYEMPVVPVAALVSASAILNILVTISQPTSQRLSDRGATLYLVYDILQLAGLLYFTGGLTNPFSVLFLVPVTISATNPVAARNAFSGLDHLGLYIRARGYP